MNKVLIVDDNESIVKVLRFLLERQGYQVDSRDDESVYHLAETWQPSVILMDVRLPKLDGIEACQRLKTNPVTMNIPIILLTADAHVVDSSHSGVADDLLIKPFHNADLLEKVRRHAQGDGE